MVNHESGLLGVSETSSDMRDLLAREADDDPRPPKPWRCSAIRRRNGSARLPPRSADWTRSCSPAASARTRAVIRARICEGLGFLGIELDETRNASTRAVISADGQPRHGARHSAPTKN